MIDDGWGQLLAKHSAADYEHVRDYREWSQFLEAQFQRFSRSKRLLAPVQ